MPLGILFWVLLVVGLLLGGWRIFSDTPGRPYWGGGLLLLILITILGWQVFGPVVNSSGSAPTSTYRSR
jgi:hypothetical protein